MTARLKIFLAAACALLVVALSAQAQTRLGAQARLGPEGIEIAQTGGQVTLILSLSQPVPYRLRSLAAPPRLVIDLNTVDWGQGIAALPVLRGVLREARAGHLADGWARLVLDLAGPYGVLTSEQSIHPETGAARLEITLARLPLEEFERQAVNEADFAARSSPALLHPEAGAPAAAPEPRKPLVMLDPGHGGIDPGAERAGLREADLVLDFARRFRAVLLRRGLVDVAMTRERDEFVSLDGRIRAARQAGADLFLSLHADALPEGMASGAVIYLLGDKASDDSAAYLAARHDRADMLAGVDLSGNTDDIARVLMSIAWQDTAPRARALSEALVEGMGTAGLRLHRRPIQSGAFTVLRAVDMPSALIELGFMSSPRDMADLQDPDWQDRMAEALADGLEAWLEADAAMAGLRRK